MCSTGVSPLRSRHSNIGNLHQVTEALRRVCAVCRRPRPTAFAPEPAPTTARRRTTAASKFGPAVPSAAHFRRAFHPAPTPRGMNLNWRLRLSTAFHRREHGRCSHLSAMADRPDPPLRFAKLGRAGAVPDLASLGDDEGAQFARKGRETRSGGDQVGVELVRQAADRRRGGHNLTLAVGFLIASRSNASS